MIFYVGLIAPTVWVDNILLGVLKELIHKMFHTWIVENVHIVSQV